MTRRAHGRFSRRALAAMCACLAFTSTFASPAHAADDDEELRDGRLVGYEGENQPMLGGGVALNYAVCAVLGALVIGVTFKNARRTHLD